MSRSLNSRSETLGQLLKNAAAVTKVLAERSQQVNTLILNGNDLLAVLVERRDAISRLLANTAAVAKNLTGLVTDNEAELAPTLDRLNAVTAMLEKNRDNLSRALPGLKKFEITTSESVASGRYYSAYVPEYHPAAVLAAVPRLRVRLPRGTIRTCPRALFPMAPQRHSGGFSMRRTAPDDRCSSPL